MTPNMEVLPFVEQEDSGFRLTLSPCGGRAFVAPTAAQIARTLACHGGASCDRR